MFNIPTSAKRRWVCWTSKSDLSSVTKNIAMIVSNLVTPKAAAKHEHLINKPASVSAATLLNKSLCFATALSVTKLIIISLRVWSHFIVLPKSHTDVQQTPPLERQWRSEKNVFRHFRPEGDAVKVQGGRNPCQPVEHLKDTSFKHSLESFF